MLKQEEVVSYLSQSPKQHEAFQILWAYIYSKSSRGNLPSQTINKIASIHRKLVMRNMGRPLEPPVSAAFDAIHRQLRVINAKFFLEGAKAFGPFGYVGPASSDAARMAWTKATDGKVTTFSDVNGIETDAGRVDISPEGFAHPRALYSMVYSPPVGGMNLPRMQSAPVTEMNYGTTGESYGSHNGHALALNGLEPSTPQPRHNSTSNSAPLMHSNTQVSSITADNTPAIPTETNPFLAVAETPSTGEIDIEKGAQNLARLRAERNKKEGKEDFM